MLRNLRGILRFSILSIHLIPSFMRRKLCLTPGFCCHPPWEASQCFLISLCSLPYAFMVLGKKALVMEMLLTGIPWRPCRRRCHLSLPLVPMEVVFSLAECHKDSWAKLVLHFTGAALPLWKES